MEQKIKFPRSQKVYLPGKLYPNIRVAMRKVEQVPSVSFEGEEKIATPNPEIRPAPLHRQPFPLLFSHQFWNRPRPLPADA